MAYRLRMAAGYHQRFARIFSGAMLLMASISTQALGDSQIVNRVVMELQIQGLTKEGCIVEIAPGHPGCKFKKVRYKVDNPRVLLKPIEVTTLSADRDCSFAITIKEPGMPEQTIRRGMRLTRPESADSIPESRLTCYLATPSQVEQARTEKLVEPRGGKVR